MFVQLTNITGVPYGLKITKIKEKYETEKKLLEKVKECPFIIQLADSFEVRNYHLLSFFRMQVLVANLDFFSRTTLLMEPNLKTNPFPKCKNIQNRSFRFRKNFLVILLL